MKKTVKLHEISKIYSGGTPSRTNKNYWNGKIPWVKTAQVQNKVIEEIDIEEYISEEGLKHSSAKIVPKGTIIMAMYGQGKTRGQVGILGLDASINQACAAIKLKDGVNRVFVYQQLLYKYDLIRRMSNSGSQENLSLELIKRIEIFLPPLPEQKAIADILSTWDEAIEKTEKLIKEKEKKKGHLIYEIIIEPALSGKWNEQPARKLFKERRESNCNDLNLLSITGNEGIIPRDETNRKDSSNEDKSKYLRICPDDIGYNTMRMWQGVSALSELEGIVSPAYTIVTPKKDLHPKFVAYLFKTPFMIHRFYRYSQGLTSDTWNLKFHHFAEVKIPFPPLSEQKSIAETLNTAQDEINILKKLSEKYKKQKQGLMQKLLTGEWRVNGEVIKKMEA
ncbi:MAG TPA: restriction endonuclease subunit S [bacterium]|nr:restriction endonuclease subunit S [bacterium]